MRVEMNCPECMCAFSACECPGDSLRVFAVVLTVATIVALILGGCSGDGISSRDAGPLDGSEPPGLPQNAADEPRASRARPPAPCGVQAVWVGQGRATQHFDLVLPCPTDTRVSAER